jgi:hypothetical protein
MLFEEIEKQSQIQNAPLAERVRPQNINDLIGQEHLIGLDAPIRKFIEYGEILPLFFGDRQELVKLPWLKSFQILLIIVFQNFLLLNLA